MEADSVTRPAHSHSNTSYRLPPAILWICAAAVLAMAVIPAAFTQETPQDGTTASQEKQEDTGKATESSAGAESETKSGSDEAEADEDKSGKPAADGGKTEDSSDSRAGDDDTKEDTPEKTEGSTEENEEPAPKLPPPFKSLPYAVTVSIGFERRCLPDPAQREHIARSIRYAIARMYGRMWEVEVVLNNWMIPANRRHLEWLNADDMLVRYPERDVHKAFLVSIESSGAGYTISCREFDSRIHELTPVAMRTTWDERAIGVETAKLLRDSFRPCVLYQRGYQDENGRPMMEMQVQAGEIIPPDPTAEQVVEDDVLRPFVRQMDRREPTKLDRLRRLELSYVRVISIDRGDAVISDPPETSGDPLAPVEIPLEPAGGAGGEDNAEATETPELGGHSPGRLQGFYITHHPMSPFGAKGRRLQHFAVRQRRTADQSKVRIVLRGRPDKPLVSHRLALAYQLHWKDEEDGPQTHLVSDRNGEVMINARKDHPTFWIRVYSGASLLARVPYAPGLIPFDTIELPDDSIRLSVEGEIQLLADELIDAIALRSVLLARARKAAAKGDVAGLDALLERQESVPEKDYFLKQIENIRIPAVNKCEERRMSPRLVNKLCDGLETTVTRFFSDEKRGERLREISVLKATAAKNAAGGGN